MKIKETKDFDENEPLTTRIKSLEQVCQFDLLDFYEENKGLVKKFLNKNTLKLEVSDFEDIPEDWYYKNQEGILRHGIKNKPFNIPYKISIAELQFPLILSIFNQHLG